MTNSTTTEDPPRRKRGKGAGRPPPSIVLNGALIGAGGAGGDSPRKAGRPSTYSEETADAICAWMAEGRSLLSYCKQAGAPDRLTVYHWLDANPSFALKFSQARDRGIDAIAELAHDAATENLPPEAVPSARLALDARKWFCSKLAPGRYGDRVNLKAEVTGANGGPLTVQAIALIDILSNPEKLAERLPLLTDEQLRALQDALPALLGPDPRTIEGESTPEVNK
jgi:hypothetical protein